MSAPPTDPVEVAPLGPAAAVKSVPTLILLSSTLFTAEGVIIRRTTSVDEPPSCRPALAPPMVYMAGADHSSPLKFLPLRQVIGPRPPLPPTPTANFFTPGKTRMQLAVTSRLGGTTLLSSIACNTAVALSMASSSLPLSAPHAGRVEIKSRGASNQDTAVLIFKVGIQRLFHCGTTCQKPRTQFLWLQEPPTTLAPECDREIKTSDWSSLVLQIAFATVPDN